MRARLSKWRIFVPMSNEFDDIYNEFDAVYIAFDRILPLWASDFFPTNRQTAGSAISPGEYL
jgi:hypothetical protein